MGERMTDPIVTSSQEVSTVDERLHWPAPERNKDAILQVLREYIPHTPGRIGYVLDSGWQRQHAAHFAVSLPDTIWQASDPDPHHLASIKAWLDRTGSQNTRTAMSGYPK